MTKLEELGLTELKQLKSELLVGINMANAMAKDAGAMAKDAGAKVLRIEAIVKLKEKDNE
jgi:hypothetical protein